MNPIQYDDLIALIGDIVGLCPDDYMRVNALELIGKWKQQDLDRTQLLYQNPFFSKLMNEIQDALRHKDITA